MKNGILAIIIATVLTSAAAYCREMIRLDGRYTKSAVYQDKIEKVLADGFQRNVLVSVLFLEHNTPESIVGVRFKNGVYSIFRITSPSFIWGTFFDEESFSKEIQPVLSEVEISDVLAKRIIDRFDTSILSSKPLEKELDVLDGSKYIFFSFKSGSSRAVAYLEDTNSVSDSRSVMALALRMHAASGGLCAPEMVFPFEP